MNATPRPDMPNIRRRRLQRRRRWLLRVDLGFALLLALAALLLSPGLAMVAVVALLVLAVCLVSLAIGRWRSRPR